MRGKRWVAPAVAVVVLVIAITLAAALRPKETIRPPAVAGTFYPASREELTQAVETYLEAAKPEKLEHIRGLVAPHAGYVYSGPTAAYGYKAVTGRRYKTVIIMGPSHQYPLRGASIPNVVGYETPLGVVRVSPLAATLQKNKTFTDVPAAHKKEHSIEVQLPFLQTALGEFELVPILIGDADSEKIAEALLEHLDDETLLVASSDLSHYLPYETAKTIDGFTVRTITEGDADLIELCQACGKTPIAVLLRIAREKGWHPHELDSRNSGDTAGPKSEVVGYCSVAFTEETEPFVPPQRSHEPLDEAAQQKLLELARASLAAAVKGKAAPEPDVEALPEAVRQYGGAFVTLTKNRQLRGCIGHILPYAPLYETVIECAGSAALHDHRFLPVKARELEAIHIEVSVLTVPERVEASSPEALLEKLVPGKDGVYLVVGPYASTYLPQVWEQLPEKEAFMSELSRKAGLGGDAWQRPAARVYVYHAQVFEEARDEPTE